MLWGQALSLHDQNCRQLNENAEGDLFRLQKLPSLCSELVVEDNDTPRFDNCMDDTPRLEDEPDDDSDFAHGLNGASAAELNTHWETATAEQQKMFVALQGKARGKVARRNVELYKVGKESEAQVLLIQARIRGTSQRNREQKKRSAYAATQLQRLQRGKQERRDFRQFRQQAAERSKVCVYLASAKRLLGDITPPYYYFTSIYFSFHILF